MHSLESLFLGRISRSQFCLGVILIVGAPFLLEAILSALMKHPVFFTYPVLGLIILYLILVLTFLPILFGLCARRCHDIGIPGSSVLLLFFPFINFILALYLLLMPGQRRVNSYGPVPPRRIPLRTLLLNT